MVGVAVTFVGHPLAVIVDPFALIGFALALVFAAVPVVGDPFALVGKAVAFVGFAVALVSEVVALFRGAHPFGAFDEPQFLQPTAGLARDPAKERSPAPFLGRTFTFVCGASSYFCGAKPLHSCFTGVRR
ncbi:hypothetical protein ABZV93_26290 [Actinopolymorpha sp. NPDC004070]|uniref:hypothetical protein n=1 Tax=Actinopolymorpha sp. NPDC004070 TaxID=3154548 RepID=UPI0033B1BAFC